MNRTHHVLNQASGQVTFGIFSGVLVLISFLMTIAWGGETNSVAISVKPVLRSEAPNLQNLAAQNEHTGRKNEAAVLYEEMARTNPAARKVLSPRLVTIYVETGETNKALAWARHVMGANPDPQAYLAGVHARLGQWKEARNILEHEIAGNTNTVRAVTLRWQLAEVYAQAGDGANASRLLKEAAGSAKGTTLETSAQRRLKTFNGGKE